MSPQTEAAWKKYRDEKLLPRAIEEEKENKEIRRISGWMLVASVCYLVLAAIILGYLEKRYGIPVQGTWQEMMTAFPPSLLGAIGLMGFIAHKGNSVVELTSVGDTYRPKEP